MTAFSCLTFHVTLSSMVAVFAAPGYILIKTPTVKNVSQLCFLLYPNCKYMLVSVIMLINLYHHSYATHRFISLFATILRTKVGVVDVMSTIFSKNY